MSETLRVLIVDDEPLARTRLVQLLADERGVEVVGEAGRVAEARALVEAERPDVLLLDVQMPGESGFELIESLPPDRRPGVIFVSAHDQHAVRAFSVRAVDYLLKPFDRERLRAALERAAVVRRSRARFGAGASAAHGADSAPGREPRYLERFVVRSVGRMLLVDADEVDWIEAAGNYVRLHHGGQKHLLRETMASLEAQLDPRRFARIHRSTIVHLDRVRELHHILHGDYSVFLRDGTRLTLLRGYRESFERLIAGATELRLSG
jgi:two-component system LytT family response regulator